MTGYLRLARSLIRFCGMRFGEAAAFVRDCAGEPLDFSLWYETMPYLTEVQLYKSMRALFLALGGDSAASDSETVSHLRALMNDVSDRFRRAYDMEITDSRTVYAMCEPPLSPIAEPVSCLRFGNF